jgi:di/tricarboxylate transporter
MIPFALALQKTGGTELAVEGFLRVFGQREPLLLLAVLFGLTALIGLFISNTATAVLMIPIALSVAHHLNASPYPFAMIVALAASTAFMTPISSPVNMLVLGPGQYRFTDFVKVGVPFTVLVMLISVLLVPWLLPLHVNGQRSGATDQNSTKVQYQTWGPHRYVLATSTRPLRLRQGIKRRRQWALV